MWWLCLLYNRCRNWHQGSDKNDLVKGDFKVDWARWTLQVFVIRLTLLHRSWLFAQHNKKNLIKSNLLYWLIVVLNFLLRRTVLVDFFLSWQLEVCHSTIHCARDLKNSSYEGCWCCSPIFRKIINNTRQFGLLNYYDSSGIILQVVLSTSIYSYFGVDLSSACLSHSYPASIISNKCVRNQLRLWATTVPPVSPCVQDWT